MQFGSTLLYAVPIRAQASEKSEMVSQLLFGEPFAVLEAREKWTRIKSLLDKYEGWIASNQWIEIEAEAAKNRPVYFAADLVNALETSVQQSLGYVPLGAILSEWNEELSEGRLGSHAFVYKGSVTSKVSSRKRLVENALRFLNAPYLWGGKTPFGIDCSGLVQMVYRLSGKFMPRDAWQQAEMKGKTLGFLAECKPGDLAFFDNEEGKIVHVGILLSPERILHASGFVRIDGIDQSGIYNATKRMHTHKLRLLKRFLAN